MRIILKIYPQKCIKVFQKGKFSVPVTVLLNTTLSDLSFASVIALGWPDANSSTFREVCI